jgi:tight adherence protein C
MILLLLLAIVMLAVSVALALRAATQGRARNQELLAQVGAYGFGAELRSTRERRTNGFTSAALAQRIGTRLEGRMPADKSRDLRMKLNAAGLYRTTVPRYLGYRILAAFGIPLVLILLAVLGGGVGILIIAAAVTMGGFGWSLPPFYLARRIRLRSEAIDLEMPELVDLLVATVEAGVGFGSALQLSARRVREPLGAELRLTLREQSMGLTMEEALENMLSRCNQSTSMRAFVQAIIQGETLGVSIGKILRDLAIDMRKRRRQWAEERAQKAPVKLLFPLTFMILPAMMIVILGPAIYSLAHGLSNGFGFSGP